MNRDFIVPDNWSIIEEGFEKERVKSSESLFSIGNGSIGQRANFEESYSGPSLQGSYIAGVYYADKIEVGWRKNGYPEISTKVLNAPNWIGIDVEINGEPLDLNTCKSITEFRRELNMREGWYQRNYTATLPNDTKVRVTSTRFLSMELNELGVINYEVELLSGDGTITFKPYLDGGITNTNSNWDEKFWEVLDVKFEGERGYITSKSLKTEFHVCTFMEPYILLKGMRIEADFEKETQDEKVVFSYTHELKKGDKLTLRKYAGYVTDMNHKRLQLTDAAKSVLENGIKVGYEDLLNLQREAWAKIWEVADISIIGDIRAQQGIRFNIFQLNQTYTGRRAA